jgi:hypothetical protein
VEGESNEVVVEKKSQVKMPDIGSMVSDEPVPHFWMLSEVPSSHRFQGTSFQPANSRNFLKTIQREIGLLRNNLPEGILVKGYEDRMVISNNLTHWNSFIHSFVRTCTLS